MKPISRKQRPICSCRFTVIAGSCGRSRYSVDDDAQPRIAAMVCGYDYHEHLGVTWVVKRTAVLSQSNAKVAQRHTQDLIVLQGVAPFPKRLDPSPTRLERIA